MTMASGKRLIDANRALEIVHEQGIAHPNAYYLTNYAMLVLQEAPTVDAVEVVRCKDCVSHNLCKFEQSQGLDGFCSYGERKCNGK